MTFSVPFSKLPKPKIKHKPINLFEIKKFQIIRGKKLKRYVSFYEAYYSILKGKKP